MKVTVIQTYAGHVNETIKVGDKDKIQRMIRQKEKALIEAQELADFYKDYKPDFANQELSRVNRLQREINQLKKSLN